jgi:transcriptional regulator GlxA family with amidase domain
MANPTRRAGPGDVIEVGMLLYAGAQQSAVLGMADLLKTASDLSARLAGPTFRISQWREDPSGAVKCTDVAPRHPLSLIYMPGRLAGPVSRQQSLPSIRWLLKRHAAGATLASSCGGSFLLAEAGLLDGRTVTTHWSVAGQLAARFPNVKLAPDEILIDDGDIVTAGGLMAWTDLGIHLIGRFLGGQVMSEVARFFLIDPAGREQRHYSDFVPNYAHGDEAIVKVQRWLDATGARHTTVKKMATVAALEERTFLRRFRAATNTVPSQYAQRLRVTRARSLLQQTRLAVSEIGRRVGYGDAPTFGRLFTRIVGLTPGEYRRRFRGTT